jgi:hypothetical protein
VQSAIPHPEAATLLAKIADRPICQIQPPQLFGDGVERLSVDYRLTGRLGARIGSRVDDRPQSAGSTTRIVIPSV